MARTNMREIVHFVVSLIVLTIAFTYPSTSPETLTIIAFAVGTGFLLHELAHKVMAQKYGYSANYETSQTGLILALGLSFITGGRLVFAAPGAVMIHKRQFYTGPEDRLRHQSKAEKEFAYISVSGAAVNLMLAVFFYIASSFAANSGIAYSFLFAGARINVFLAGFNMIPFGPLDGAKVWRHDPLLWALIGIPSLVLFFIL